jgi:alkanesulfonate monooxygenase SsuD/methylene tetrahydromethanopterin reductase-like flavin-dependent oxidoreductase (luciferase family)
LPCDPTFVGKIRETGARLAVSLSAGYCQTGLVSANGIVGTQLPPEVQPMRFGVFTAPFLTQPGESPNLGLHGQLELAKHLDNLGYDEIWFGEHHSGGAELVTSPEVFCAWIAGQTRRIKLGAGVVSLPYHNPLWVADRAILLDHVTRGRFMLGIGPGALPTDADMVGLDVGLLRDYLQEDFPVLMQLLRGTEPVTIDTGRYKLNDATVQLGPYSDFDVALTSIYTSSGPLLAGRFGVGLLQLSGLTPASLKVLGTHSQTIETQTAKYGTTFDRSDWRVVSIMHLAETKDRAIEEVRYGLNSYFDYFQDVVGLERYLEAGRSFNDRLEWAIESGSAIVGTPADAIEQLHQLQSASNGGVGAFLFWGTDWASPQATLDNYSLFAHQVIPEFQSARTKVEESRQRVARRAAELSARSSSGRAAFEAKTK